MKQLFILGLLITAIGCGKDNKSSSSKKDYDLKSLQNSGVYFMSSNNLTYGAQPMQGNSLVIGCQSNGKTTNQTRVNELSSFMNKIGLNSSKTEGYEVAGMKLNPYQLSTALNQAIYTLQYSNPHSTECPRQILAQSY